MSEKKPKISMLDEVKLKQPLTIPISLSIDDLGDGFYDEVLEEFKHVIARMGHDPDKFFYDQWRITCVAEEDKA
jgi:hypothetical protein